MATKSKTATARVVEVVNVKRGKGEEDGLSVPIPESLIAEHHLLASELRERTADLKAVDARIKALMEKSRAVVGTVRGQAVVELQHRHRIELDAKRLRMEQPAVARVYDHRVDWTQLQFLGRK